MIARTLATRRLRLRALTRRDLKLIRTLYCDAETMRHIAPPLSRENAAASLRAAVEAARAADGPQFFVMIERRGRQPVGLCSIKPTDDSSCPELGLMLVRAARQLGYATEALGKLIAVAFETLPIAAVSVQYQQVNVGARRLCDTLGFSRSRSGNQTGSRVRTLRRQRAARQLRPV